MNYEGLEPKTFYEKLEQKHLNEFRCFAFVVLVCLAMAATIALILGGWKLGLWLLGGA